jgi:hypothetical protein
MDRSISELSRCVRPGGYFLSLAGVVNEQIDKAFQARQEEWSCLVRNGDLYVSKEGFTSNNLDGSFMVWQKRR